ncbi:MAG: hypothetical protein QOE50_1224 [Sphingomonadales bacterium]|nr:hypothetical protein [Sphingomonadales bacterium]
MVAVAVTSVVITRLLGPAGIGTYAISAALLYVFTIIFELGISQGTAYYVSRGEWRGHPLARGVIGACVVLGGVGAAVALAAYSLIGYEVPGMTWPMAVALSAALPFSLVWRIGPQAALAEERFELFALFDSSALLLACPLSIGGALIGDAEGAVIGLAAAWVISGAVTAAWVLRRDRQEAEAKAPSGGILAVAAFGSRAWGSELLQQLNLRADLILLGAIAGAAEGGVYSVALTTTSIAWILTDAFAISALPRSARLHAESEREVLSSEDRDASDARLMRHTILVIPVVALFEAALLLIGIPLFYGDAFHRSIGLGFILLPGSLALGVGRAALAILLAHGYANRVLGVGLAVVPATVVAYLLVLPSAGATGAAIVSSVSYVAYTVIGIAVLAATTGLSIRNLLLPGSSDLDDYRAGFGRGLAYAARLRRS